MENYFDRLYAAGKEVIDLAKKPFVKRALKRKFQSAYDDALNQEIEEEKKIEDLRSKFDDFDINSILELKRRIKRCREIKDDVAGEYLKMFGKEMKIDEEED
jgi:hypothetical protein